MATKAKRSVSAPRRPEKKWGPFHGGVGVAVWLNEAYEAFHGNPGDAGTRSPVSGRTPRPSVLRIFLL